MRGCDSKRVWLFYFFFARFSKLQLVEHQSKIASATHYADCKLKVGKRGKNGKCLSKSQLCQVNTRKSLKAFCIIGQILPLFAKENRRMGKDYKTVNFHCGSNIIFHHQSSSWTPALSSPIRSLLDSLNGIIHLVQTDGLDILFDRVRAWEPNWIMAWLKTSVRHRGLINFQSHVSFNWSDDRMGDCLAFLSTNC